MTVPDTSRPLRAATHLAGNPSVISSEDAFYAAYDWALDPVLSVRELFLHLREALAQLESLNSGWQIEECKTNLYLFACALTCTVDDYLGEAPRNLAKVSRSFPAARIPVAAAQKVLNAAHRMSGWRDKSRVARFRTRWTATVDLICKLLLQPGKPPLHVRNALNAELQGDPTVSLPVEILERRMQLPSGYRSQDLAHQDAFALAELFSASQLDRQTPLLIIGPRSMGAYFAPPVAAKLSELGCSSVAWLTLRPKKGISPWEKQLLHSLLGPNLRVLVVDESPNTGNTFSLMLNLLDELGVPPHNVFLLVALHPTRPNWRLPEKEKNRGVRPIYLDAHRLHKNRLLEPDTVLPLLASYCDAQGWDGAEIVQNQSVAELNAQLEEHFQDGFHCRLKRVFELSLKKNGHLPTTKRFLAKSVGWGWLGYHAFFAGQQLQQFVPKVLGLRDGILFMEWLDPEKSNSSELPIPVFADYVAARARKLPLHKDPTFAISPGYGWTGWSVLVDTLKPAFGRFLGRMKIPALRRQLERFLHGRPALTDGQMKPADWLKTADGYRKVDFEHHNFGRTELYITDPAYDLASAVCEFRMSAEDERQMVARYIRSSDDPKVEDRILLWKLLHGTVVMGQANAALTIETRSLARHSWHERMFLARNFLVQQMNLFSASLLPSRPRLDWTHRIIFLDLDGVFDRDIFGFPQATKCSLAALVKLRNHGFSVILNTARSVADVRQYCQTYGFHAGVAELGCIFVDNVSGKEFSLVDTDALEQLAFCRKALQSLSDVFVDPNYQAAVRAFRYGNRKTMGLSEDEVREVLSEAHLDQLTFHTTTADTTILPKGVGKAFGLQWAKRYLQITNQPVAAIGDNDQDVAMLTAAELAFAPADSARSVRALAAQGKCKLARQPQQRGLLEAVAEIVHLDGGTCPQCEVELLQPSGCGSLFSTLMEVADRSTLQKFFSAFNREGL